MRYILLLSIISLLSFSGFVVSQTSLANTIETLKADNKNLNQKESRISLEDAKKEFDAGTAILVDARGEDLFKQEHIKGAISVPAESFEKSYKKIPKDKKIIAYCSCPAEQTSLYLVEKLKEKGITAYALVGGNRAWKEAGYPVESSK